MFKVGGFRLFIIFFWYEISCSVKAIVIKMKNDHFKCLFSNF